MKLKDPHLLTATDVGHGGFDVVHLGLGRARESSSGSKIAQDFGSDSVPTGDRAMDGTVVSGGLRRFTGKVELVLQRLCELLE